MRALAAGAHLRRFVDGTARIERGLRLLVGTGSRVSVYVDSGTWIQRDASLVIEGGTVFLGPDTTLGRGAYLETRDGAVLLVEGMTCGVGVVLRAAAARIEVGPGASLGDMAVVRAEHGRDVVVGAGAVVGTKAVLLPGTVVAPGATVPPNTVVNGAFPAPDEAPRTQTRGPEISVVVPTKDRPQEIRGLLHALAAQTLPVDRFEVVVVEDGSAAGNELVVDELERTLPFPLRVVHRDTASGPAAARNAGWRTASSSLIAFTDDDCLPDPGWLAGLIAAGTDGAVVQGKTLPDPEQAMSRGWLRYTIRVGRPSSRGETCNMAYPRDLLERLGGFDEAFPSPLGEDTDLVFRANDLGVPTTFAPGAIVYHEVRRVRLRDLARRARRMSSLVLLLRKHRGSRRVHRLGYFVRPAHALLLLAAAGIVAGVMLSPWAFLAAAPYVLARRAEEFLPRGPVVRILLFPVLFLADLMEMGVLIAASIRHRRLLL
ncbi:MAG: glycosyltransferase family 2 protein [Actinomycetota bacterium]